MKTILVPVDGSRLASAALPVAEEAAREREARVLLLTVGEVAETSTHRAVEEHDLHAIIEAATRELSGVTVVSRIEMSGAPADTILRVAEEEGVDRIIMSTHGGSGMSAWVHGSVAEAVLRHSSIPVTLVRPGGDHEAGQRILLESSDRALAAAAASALVAMGARVPYEELEPLRQSIAATDSSHKLAMVEDYLALLSAGERSDAAISFLRDGDALEREGALQLVVDLGEAVIPALVELTDAAAVEVQWIAYHAIRRIGGERALAPLIRGLGNDELAIRWVASNGLEQFGDRALAPLLKALVTERPTIPFHRSAARVLRRLPGRAHEATMTRLLRSLGRATTSTQSPPIAQELLRALEHAAAD